MNNPLVLHFHLSTDSDGIHTDLIAPEEITGYIPLAQINFREYPLAVILHVKPDELPVIEQRASQPDFQRKVEAVLGHRIQEALESGEFG